jgi:multicomponent Na+:H+ antiporter subunit D
LNSGQLLVPLIITALAPLGIYAARANVNVREGVSFLAGGLTFLSVLWLVPPVLDGEVLDFTLLVLFDGVALRFAADGLSMIFALVASFLWILATGYNIGYMRALEERSQTRYYICFALAIFGALGVAFSGNLFTLYLFYEVITISTYPLVAHHGDKEAYEGARKYLIYLLGSSKAFLFPAIVATYLLAGTLDFNLADVSAGMFPDGASRVAVTVTYALFIAGLAKAAIMPLHNWLPSAMVAPTPVSALLHAVAVVKAGVFSIARVILSVFGLDTMDAFHLGIPTAYLAAFTIVTASVIALTKDDLKARLAYSTVSQLSYIVLGLAMLNSAAVAGGTLHIAHHAFGKITLFFTAGAIYVASGKKKISQTGGLGRQMPWTYAALSVASLSMIGIPPLSGFVSKWLLLLGTVGTGHLLLLAALLASTVLNAVYLGQIVYTGYFGSPDLASEPAGTSERPAPTAEAPSFVVVPLVITAMIALLMGLFPGVLYRFVAVLLPVIGP